MINKNKVLQIIGNLNIGGAETVAMNLYRYINRDVYEFHYVVYDEIIGDYESEVYALGGMVFHVPHPRKGRVRFMKNLNSIISTKGPYVAVHSHMMFSSGMMVYVASKNKVPIRITHSHTIQNKLNVNIKTLIYEKFMRVMINKNSTACLACSKRAGEYLFGDLKFKNEGQVIPNGVDVKKFSFDLECRREIRKKYMIENEKVIGTVGHLAKVKNQEFLVRIFAKLHDKEHNVRLLIVGEGEEHENLINLINSLGIKPYVIMTGNVDNVHEYLSAMDVFVFPSKYEGLGISIIEAQANGLPCLISENIPEEVFITDLIKSLPFENIDEWIQYILKMHRVNAKQYTQIIESKGYSIEKNSDLFGELYSKGIV